MMYKIDKLTLISGIDIPIPELTVNINQPTIREIAYIGETRFFACAQTLTLTTEKFLESVGKELSNEDRIAISQMSNFQLLMMMSGSDTHVKIDMLMLLTLLFPNHMIELEERFIMLIDQRGDKPNTVMIDENNFSVLQDVVKIILCLDSSIQKEDFNPGGDLAREIAEKIKRGREKTAALKGETKKEVSFLSKYISALSIGTDTIDIHKALDLTLYQLFDQIERFSLHESYNIAIKAKMAGAKNVEDVDWLKDIDKN